MLSITSSASRWCIGVWLISYLGIEEGVGVGAAGAIAFGLFGLSAATRYLGGVASARGASPSLIALFGCLVGALGIAVIAVGDGIAAAIAGVVLLGASISVPASLVYDEGENVLPGRPARRPGPDRDGRQRLPDPRDSRSSGRRSAPATARSRSSHSPPSPPWPGSRTRYRRRRRRRLARPRGCRGGVERVPSPWCRGSPQSCGDSLAAQSAWLRSGRPLRRVPRRRGSPSPVPSRGSPCPPG